MSWGAHGRSGFPTNGECVARRERASNHAGAHSTGSDHADPHLAYLDTKIARCLQSTASACALPNAVAELRLARTVFADVQTCAAGRRKVMPKRVVQRAAAGRPLEQRLVRNESMRRMNLALDAELEQLQRQTFGYLQHETNPANGLVIDKTAPDWPASIAATGLADAPQGT